MDLASLLHRYGARRARLERPSAPPLAAEGSGGGLIDAVERLGVADLAGLLADGESLTLADDAVKLTLRRANGQVHLTTRWEGGLELAETLPVLAGAPAPPPPAAAAGGRASAAKGADLPLFQPDPAARVDDLRAALHDAGQPLYVTASGVYTAGGYGAGEPLLALVPAVRPEDLGDPTFCQEHGVLAPYIAGAMAGGIGSADIVIAMGRAGLLGFFGAGGLPLDEVERSVARIKAELGERPCGFNLLHNPAEPAVEEATVDLYLRYGCRYVSASAYMTLTPAVVRYRLTGARLGSDGRIRCPNRVFAKLSRPEVAERFLRPAPPGLLDALVARGGLTPEEAACGRRVPVAEDITAEADSGGHTDHRPLSVLLPTLLRLRDRVMAEERYGEQGVALRVGAAGGLGDPAAVNAAFSAGAAYVLTGSINQPTVEAGTSDLAKRMLTEASMTDCADGAAPDMFEMGAHVQVLSRGTMYAQRSQRLYQIYRDHDSLEAIPADERQKLERNIFRRPLDEVWAETLQYWQGRDPGQLARAEQSPRHKMALTFRWYLGQSSRWARLGVAERQRDFQIWCGPAIGSFNDWVRGTWLEPLENRRVVEIAWAMLHGAAALRRVALAKALLAGKVVLPEGLEAVAPRRAKVEPAL